MPRYLKRTARVDDIVERNNRQYRVLNLLKTNGGRTYLLDVESCETGLPQAFVPIEVSVINAREASHYREQHKTCRIAKPVELLEVTMSDDEHDEEQLTYDEQRDDLCKLIARETASFQRGEQTASQLASSLVLFGAELQQLDDIAAGRVSE